MLVADGCASEWDNPAYYFCAVKVAGAVGSGGGDGSMLVS
jgi:hypothetical protein